MKLRVVRDTIANRILLVNVLLTVGAVAVTTLSATLLLRTYLHQRLDDQLAAVAKAPGVLPAAARLPSPCGREVPDGAVLPSDFTLTFLDRDGEVVCRLGSDEAVAPLPDVVDLPDLAATGEVVTLRSDGSGAWRSTVLTAPETAGSADGSGSGVSYAVVSLSLADATAIVRRLTIIGVAVGLVVVVLVAVGSRALVRMGLRPLTRIRETTRAIAAGDLAARVPHEVSVAEAAELSAALNTMLTEVERSVAREQEASSQVRRFAADASHELRTPLTSITGYAQLFRQVGPTADSAQAAQIIDRIDAEAQRMAGIVADLLLLARLDREPVLDVALVDLLEVAHDVIADARVRHPERSVSLVVLSPADDLRWQPPPFHVRGDDNALRQVAGNLVSNALDHTPTTSAVTMKVGRTRDHTVLVVHDEGPGMPAEVRDHVFERFYRGDAARSRSRTPGGTGLGLAIVAALVAAHDGDVHCDSTPESGSTFTVTLPGAVVSEPVE